MFDLHVNLTLKLHLISNNFQISNFGPRLEYVASGRTYHSVKWKQEPVLRQVTGLEVKLVWHRNSIEKIKWIPHRYFVSFENRIYVKFSSSKSFPPGLTFYNRYNVDAFSMWNFDIEWVANQWSRLEPTYCLQILSKHYVKKIAMEIQKLYEKVVWSTI